MNAMNMVLLASTNHLIAINRESRIHRERRERRERHACECRWFKIVSHSLPGKVATASSLSLPLASDRHHGSSRTAVGGDHGHRKRRGASNASSRAWGIRSQPGGGTGGKVGASHPNGDGPRLEVPVEGSSRLQRSEGRASVWSERRSRSEGIGNGRRRRRYSDARAATREMEEHVRRTSYSWSSPSSCPSC